jgi:hypothetical protein
MAAEIGKGQAGFQGDAVFEEQGAIAGADALVVLQLGVEMGYSLPGVVMDGDLLALAADPWPIRQRDPAATWGLAGGIPAIARPPAAGAEITLWLCLAPDQTPLAAAPAIGMGLLQQRQRCRQHQPILGIEPEGAGGVQIPDLPAAQLTGQQAR